MTMRQGYSEPVGAATAGGDGAEVVLSTSEGTLRVRQTWEGWTTTLLLLQAINAELRGITVQSTVTGEVVAFENEWRPMLSLPAPKPE